MLRRLAMGVEPESYTYGLIPADLRMEYCARDAVSTGKIHCLLEEELEEDIELHRHWKEVVLPFEHAITEMEWNGIAVSKVALAGMQASLRQKEAELAKELEQYVWPGFNVSASSHDTGKLLFGTDTSPGLGFRPERVTPSGKPGTGHDDIAHIKHPAVALILELRKVMHFRSQYGDGIEWHLRDDGRVHTSYKIDGTVTGRPSTEGPNLLNIPTARTPMGKMCRDLFVAEAGNTLVEADYSQIELRVAAMLSEDDEMLALFRSGKDFHLGTALMVAPILGVDPATVDKAHPLRDKAKTINFGVLYGKDAYGLAMELGISKREGATLVEAILGKFKKLAAWIQKCLQNGRRLGYTQTWWNGRWTRRRNLPDLAGWNDDARKTAERSTWNTPIQGTAAEFTNASLGQIQQWLDATGFPAKLVLTVYDSICSEVRSDMVDEYKAKAQSIMEGHFSNNVPIVAEFKAGPSWGTMVAL